MDDTIQRTDSLTSNPFDGLPVDVEAQSVITDFLDYTEYLPSDLFRSFTLIQTLDKQYHQHLEKIHELTQLYGKLPTLPPNQRPDPQELRKDISIRLGKAYRCRDCAYAEIVRLNETVKGHTGRLSTIKTKLEALPKPPSRDPTPVPVSPVRIRKVDLATPKLKLNLTDKKKSRKIQIGTDYPPDLPADGSDWSAGFRRSETPFSGHLKKTPKLKALPKTPKVRGSLGSNVHSSFAGISTSNALARLTPPPDDAVVGSHYRPWFRLTEYEMAKLRKQMKKNAIWTPSEAMIKRELIKDNRGIEAFEKARAEAERKGEVLLDDEPADGSQSIVAPGELNRKPVIISKTAAVPALETMAVAAKKSPKKKSTGVSEEEPVEVPEVTPENEPEDEMEETATTMAVEDTTPKSRDKGVRTRGSTSRTSRLHQVNRNLEGMLPMMRNLFSKDTTPLVSPAKEDAGRSTRKRKRSSEKDSSVVEQATVGATSVSPKQSAPKKQKLSAQSKRDKSVEAPPKAEITPVKTVTKTTTVPLAPEGPSSSPIKQNSRPSTSSSDAKNLGNTPTATAAFSRSRRISQAHTKLEDPPRSDPLSPPPASIAYPLQTAPQTDRSRRSATPILPRSTRAATRQTAPSTTKAASAEPPPSKRELRELRRLSITETAPISPSPVAGGQSAADRRRSGRRPAPGLVTAESGGKEKVSIGRRMARPNAIGAGRKDGKKGGGVGEDEEVIDPNEPRYCTCQDVSYGKMIACDNDSCEFEWYHISCLGMDEVPTEFRRAKWYCPICQTKLNVDEKGKPLPIAVATPASSRRRG